MQNAPESSRNIALDMRDRISSLDPNRSSFNLISWRAGSSIYVRKQGNPRLLRPTSPIHKEWLAVTEPSCSTFYNARLSSLTFAVSPPVF
ncbi:hypothetical protein E2C01_005591 [Portunus trituberculatus]|uniref:Uncharacterized protein n=1 Tax=Portunus trituberculatus TaxID=210409 RepID=A0A5B7CX11_PORTR|nr:hypothetical protein [Portunus trituberculatus]